jgi:hypothetical protein
MGENSPNLVTLIQTACIVSFSFFPSPALSDVVVHSKNQAAVGRPADDTSMPVPASDQQSFKAKNVKKQVSELLRRKLFSKRTQGV